MAASTGMSQPPNNRWGTIDIVPLGTSQITPRAIDEGELVADLHRYTWRPSVEVASHLPSDFSLSLTAVSNGGVERRFQPDLDPFSFSLTAALGGFAILRAMQNLNAEQRNTYDLMRLVFQHGRIVQEALTRRFHRTQDLAVTGDARYAVDDDDVLPDNLGLDGQGRDRKWRMGDLMRSGREEARRRRLREASDADFVRLGILCAARHNPIDAESLSVAEARRLLRFNLFDLGPADCHIDENTKEEIVARFREALDRHLADSTEEFDRWFFEKRDGIVHQISKRKSGLGPIAREVVRQTLLELVFDSLPYNGQCVHIQMYAFAGAILPSLTDSERSVFELQYCSQPWLGDVPLILLHRYLQPMREAIIDMWDEPQIREHPGVLLRVMQFHGEMVRKRREADRAAKRGNPDPGRRIFLSESIESDEECPDFDELKDELIRASHLDCRCGESARFSAVLDWQSASEDAIDVEFSCGGCGSKQRRSFAVDEVRRILAPS
jgi:hypothetical protein